MKFTRAHFTSVLIFFFCLSAAKIYSQTGILKGTVIDKESQLPLIAATIQLSNGQGTITDLDGNFEFKLGAGVYNLEISYIGYQTFVQQATVTENVSTELKIALETTTTLLEVATVTSGKYEKPLGEVTVSMEILQPRLIENTNKTSLDAALTKIPGVTIIDGQANIRGGSGFSQGAGSRVLLLVDDVPILDAPSGFPNWNDIAIESASQIEVLKGASSSLYGSSALNGIVNVRTAYATGDPETKGSVFYNTSFNPKDEAFKWWDSAPYHFGASLTHKQKFGKFDLVLGSYYYNEESFNKDWDREYGRFNFSTRYRITDRLTIGLNGNINAGSNRSFFYWASKDTPYIGAPNTENSSDLTRFYLDPKIQYYDKKGNQHKYLGRIYSIDNRLANNRANKALQYYNEYQFQKNFSKSNLVLTTGVVYSGSSSTAELFGDTTFTAQNLAGFLQLDKKFLDRLNVSFGFRYEYNVLKNPGFEIGQPEDGECGYIAVPKSDETDAQPVFRLGLNYELTEGTFLRGSWGQGYRYPSIAEKYIFTNVGGFSVVPNPTLGPESGWSAELGIKQGFRFSEFNGYFDAAVFTMNYDDMMEFNLTSSSIRCGANFQSVNIGGTAINGYELSIVGTGKWFSLPVNIITGYTYINPRFVEFDLTPISGTGMDTQGQINANNSSLKENVLKYRSRHVFKLDLETSFKALTFGIESFYNSNIDAIDAIFNIIVPGLGQFRAENNKGYQIHNVRIACKIGPHVRTSLIMNNLFNEIYSTRPGLLEGPRNLTAKMDFKF